MNISCDLYLQHRPQWATSRNGPSPAKAPAPPRTTLHSQTLQQQPLPSRGVQQCHVRIVSKARVMWISSKKCHELKIWGKIASPPPPDHTASYTLHPLIHTRWNRVFDVYTHLGRGLLGSRLLLGISHLVCLCYWILATYERRKNEIFIASALLQEGVL